MDSSHRVSPGDSGMGKKKIENRGCLCISLLDFGYLAGLQVERRQSGGFVVMVATVAACSSSQGRSRRVYLSTSMIQLQKHVRSYPKALYMPSKRERAMEISTNLDGENHSSRGLHLDNSIRLSNKQNGHIFPW